MKPATPEELRAAEMRLCCGCLVCGRRLLENGVPRQGAQLVPLERFVHDPKAGCAHLEKMDAPLCGICYLATRTQAGLMKLMMAANS